MASFVVMRALKRLGGDLKDARRRRRIKTALMAERVGVTRATLDRMEKGSPSVGMGIYATAIYSLDPDKLEALATIFGNDTLGQAISDRELPKRIRGRSAL
ncbi:MAG: helix-turn-helix domain-containing protein [Candidatus Accumulibacter sp.]|nr:helix-turn-helix domain-containing protein [Accumulibacter sp.]